MWRNSEHGRRVAWLVRKLSWNLEKGDWEGFPLLFRIKVIRAAERAIRMEEKGDRRDLEMVYGKRDGIVGIPAGVGGVGAFGWEGLAAQEGNQTDERRERG